MSNPKPRIRPKADSYHRRDETPLRDPPSSPIGPNRDPPVFTERDPGTERKASERVLFDEDDCLR
jgi:hypothetical protein